MPVYEIVPGLVIHAQELAANMSVADKREMWALANVSPHEAISECLRVSRDTKTGLADGRVVCMFGIIPPSTILSDLHTPWLLGTNLLPRHAKTFLRLSRKYFAGMKGATPHMVNYVDARHTAAKRWLSWLGFTLDPAKPYGVEGLPFHRFEMRP